MIPPEIGQQVRKLGTNDGNTLIPVGTTGTLIRSSRSDTIRVRWDLRHDPEHEYERWYHWGTVVGPIDTHEDALLKAFSL